MASAAGFHSYCPAVRPFCGLKALLPYQRTTRGPRSRHRGCLQLREHLRCRIIVPIDSRPAGSAEQCREALPSAAGGHAPATHRRRTYKRRTGHARGRARERTGVTTVRSHNAAGVTQSPLNGGAVGVPPAGPGVGRRTGAVRRGDAI